MTMPAFVVGFNEAWFGMHFGTGLTTDFDLAYATQVLDGIVEGKGKVVRLFLFELLQGITLGSASPQTQGVSPAMLDNLSKVIDAARARGLWVYLTALEGNSMSKVPTTKTYYENLLNNKLGEGDAFQQNVYGPLLAMLDGHQENIFGLDLVNEIDAPKKDGLWGSSLDSSGVRAYIQRTRDFIKAKSPWLRVTATMGMGGTAQYDIASGMLSGLGLDFYDLHIYSDSGSFGGATALCNKAAADGVPIYLGEFGQKTQTNDDTLQYNATSSFLWNAKSLCFKGAFAWRFDAAEAYWAYALADGGARPAMQVMQAYGAQ